MKNLIQSKLEEFDKKFISDEPKNINEKTGEKYIHYWKTDEIKQFLSQSMEEAYNAGYEKNLESIAWCECGDALEGKTVPNKKGFMVDHEYYCLGCDKTYILKSKETNE